jgi:hypothetical protein
MVSREGAKARRTKGWLKISRKTQKQKLTIQKITNPTFRKKARLSHRPHSNSIFYSLCAFPPDRQGWRKCGTQGDIIRFA